MVVPAIKV